MKKNVLSYFFKYGETDSERRNVI